MRGHLPTGRLLVLAAVLAVSGGPLRADTVTATLGIDSTRLAGTDPSGRVLLYTPNPLETGSAVSHWDASAFPNLLMEPSINSDLGYQQTDLTTFQLRDVGWTPGSSTVTLRIRDAAGQGFNDPALGAQRLAAMQAAAGVWASRLESPVEINVDIEFDELDCSTTDGAVLAQAGAQFLFESFPGAPISGTWYHGALAEALSGENLSLEDNSNPNAGDLSLTFNSRIDDACLGAGSRFYYGLDDNAPSGQASFVAVALHEMAHGLGFASFANEATGTLFMGKPDIYTRHIFDNAQGKSWIQMTNSQRQTSATTPRQVVWTGNRVTSMAHNFLQAPPALLVTAPASIAGSYEVGVAAFGPSLTAQGVTGDVVVAVDDSASPNLLCEPVSNAGQVNGKVALVDRGTCLFVEKVKNAQDAGAVGVIVVNNVAGTPPNMAGDDATIVIPSVSVSRADGDKIKAALTQVSQPGELSFTASSFEAGESAGTATITVRRTGGTDGEVSASWSTTGGGTATAGEDYLPGSGTVRFGNGKGGTRQFTVEILDDEETEGEETIELTLSEPTGGATLGSPEQAVLRIADDDMNPAGFLAFSAPSYRANESDGTVVVSVERTGGAAGATSVHYATGGGTATAPADYEALEGDVAFADGESGSKSVSVQLQDDAEEESLETFGLALSNPTGGALLGTPSSTIVEIVDNEACQPSTTQLCLNQGRFRVEVDWRDFEDRTGTGQVVFGSEDSGIFWFFNPDNWEMLVKVLTGCGNNDHYWVFAAATTNVEYTLRVTDTATGQVMEYTNPLGVSSPAITDTNAFATCP